MIRVLSFLTLLMFSAAIVFAGNYNYTTPDKMREKLSAQSEVLILDIQVEEEFKQHHLPGSLATYAYPVKSDADYAKLDQALAMQKKTGNPVVIVCPRGAGGAKRTYEYLKKNGVSEDQLSILEKGIAGWTFPEFTVAEN